MHNPFEVIDARLSNIESLILELIQGKEHKEKESYPKDERLTRAEVCKLYKISKPTIHKHMHKGLGFEKLGRKTLFRSETVEAYFRAQTR